MVDSYSGSLESAQQLANAWGAIVEDYGRSHGGADVRDAPGLSIRWADSRFAFWNCLALSGPSVDRGSLRARLQAAADYMRGKGGKGLLWVFLELMTPHARQMLPELARGVGLEHALSMHAMAGDVLPLPAPPHPALEFVRVNSEELLTAYADINSQAYGFPLEDGRDGLCGSPLWASDVHAWLALEHGVPVAAAATLPNDGRLFVALVATLPQAQRRGYGEAVTRMALHQGGQATGLTRATLHATQAGAPVYERIGLRRLGAIEAYGLAG